MKKTLLIRLKPLLSILFLVIIFSCNNSKKTTDKFKTYNSRELKSHSNPEQKILDDVEVNGFNIAITSENKYVPSFAHTIGLLKNYNHPEIIIFGLDNETMYEILTTLVTEIKNGKDYKPGNNYTDVIPNSPIKLLEVKKDNYKDYFGYARWFYNNTSDFPAYQLVWTDTNKKYPWEKGFNDNLISKQPLLDRNIDFKFYDKKNTGVFATQEVLEGKPILWVYHDDDGEWQFHSNKDSKIENALLVSLESIVKLDPSINEIYNLNYGQSATRETIKSKWRIIK